ncbi:MAG: HypC/HybG/HupF family hydrogenase formation chaperone [Bacteroidales bacterium]|nr:HypC/HybG/HupF family hydrogenase formation chaperone [Bacteroidales bacterium]HPO66258.1 HypC/HybG/HupF family hydrogenase formation chaperone [Bacteroidales bacterium]
MCLSIPAKVEKIEGNEAIVNLSGNRLKAALDLLDNVKEGDYVLVHAGYAIQKIDEVEAEETLRLIRELEEDMSND